MTAFGYTLGDIGQLLAICGLLGGAVYWALRKRLESDFASHADMRELAARLDGVEGRLAQVPNHDDLRRLAERVAGVERSVVDVSAQVRSLHELMKSEVAGTRDLLTQVQVHTRMLLRHELEREKRESAP